MPLTRRRTWGWSSTSANSCLRSGRLLSLSGPLQNEEVRLQRSFPVKEEKSIIQTAPVTTHGATGSGNAKTQSCLEEFSDYGNHSLFHPPKHPGLAKRKGSNFHCRQCYLARVPPSWRALASLGSLYPLFISQGIIFKSQSLRALSSRLVELVKLFAV